MVYLDCSWIDFIQEFSGFSIYQKKWNSCKFFHKLDDSKIQSDIICILTVTIIRKRRYKCKTITASSLASNRASLDSVPAEVLVYYICQYLKPEDIFNMGECSERMKRIVLDNSVKDHYWINCFKWCVAFRNCNT